MARITEVRDHGTPMTDNKNKCPQAAPAPSKKEVPANAVPRSRASNASASGTP